MCHLTVVGQSKDDREIRSRLKSKRIENLLALGGDPPQGTVDWQPHPDGFHHAVELVREAAALAASRSGWRVFPKSIRARVGRMSDLKYLKEKVDAGATTIITQLFL